MAPCRKHRFGAVKMHWQGLKKSAAPQTQLTAPLNGGIRKKTENVKNGQVRKAGKGAWQVTCTKETEKIAPMAISGIASAAKACQGPVPVPCASDSDPC